MVAVRKSSVVLSFRLSVVEVKVQACSRSQLWETEVVAVKMARLSLTLLSMKTSLGLAGTRRTPARMGWTRVEVRRPRLRTALAACTCLEWRYSQHSHCSVYNRTFLCMEANYPYAIKNQLWALERCFFMS